MFNEYFASAGVEGKMTEKKNEGNDGQGRAGVTKSSKCISPPTEGFGQRTDENSPE